MTNRKILALIVACLAPQLVLGSLRIINPEKLKTMIGDSEGFIDSGMGNFGHIDYGSSIVSQFNIF